MKYLWTLLRLSLAWILLWAFFDKLVGLGFSTAPAKSWLQGVSPTTGFLKAGATGILKPFFTSMAGSPLVDWLFMLGLLLIGLALLLGIGLKIAGYAGATLMGLMWLALVPSKTNPLVDDHIIYLLLFLMFPSARNNQLLSLGPWWKKTALVKKYPILE